VDRRGRVAWRLRAPGTACAPLIYWRRRCLALFATDRGGSLMAFDPSSGRRIWQAALDFTPAGPPVPFGQKVAVTGVVGGDPIVAALDASGRAVWTHAPSVGSGPLAISPLSSGLVVKTAGGACAALAGTGEIVWGRTRECAQPPPGNLPASAARGLLLVPSEQVLILDGTTGALLGTVPVVAPAKLRVEADLTVYAADALGLVTAARLKTHLSVV
jgi:outer membrane protein assembly factor BamB